MTIHYLCGQMSNTIISKESTADVGCRVINYLLKFALILKSWGGGGIWAWDLYVNSCVQLQLTTSQRLATYMESRRVEVVAEIKRYSLFVVATYLFSCLVISATCFPFCNYYKTVLCISTKIKQKKMLICPYGAEKGFEGGHDYKIHCCFVVYCFFSGHINTEQTKTTEKTKPRERARVMLQLYHEGYPNQRCRQKQFKGVPF